MTIGEHWAACTRIHAVRTTLVAIGFLLMIVAPVAGVIPGPGGIFVFAAGLALALKYSDWAKRKYVVFKRAHPKKGEWADWGLRRRSAQRRQALLKARAATDGPVEGAWSAQRPGTEATLRRSLARGEREADPPAALRRGRIESVQGD